MLATFSLYLPPNCFDSPIQTSLLFVYPFFFILSIFSKLEHYNYAQAVTSSIPSKQFRKSQAHYIILGRTDQMFKSRTSKDRLAQSFIQQRQQLANLVWAWKLSKVKYGWCLERRQTWNLRMYTRLVKPEKGEYKPSPYCCSSRIFHSDTWKQDIKIYLLNSLVINLQNKCCNQSSFFKAIAHL